MPTLPAAGYQTDSLPEVQPTVNPPEGYRRVEAEPSAFGAGIGAGLTRLGDVASKAALEKQDLYNKVSADQARNNWQDETNKILFGDPNNPADTGFYGKHGQDALDAFPDTRTRLLNARTQYGQGLNPIAKLQFDNETARLQAYLLGDVGRHYDQEFQQHAVNTAKATEQLGRQGSATAAANNDYSAFNRSVAQTMQGALSAVRARGGGQTEMDAALGAVRADATKMWASALGTKDPLGALQFLDNNKDALTGEEYSQLYRQFKAEGTKMQALIDAGLVTAPSGWKSQTQGAPINRSGTGDGHIAPKSERLAYYKEGAAKRGLNYDALEATVAGEGLNAYRGDFDTILGDYTSFGDFQLHLGGGMGDDAQKAGINVRDPNKWKEQADFVMDQMAAHKGNAGWYANQWHGAPAWAATQFGTAPTTATAPAPPPGVIKVASGAYPIPPPDPYLDAPDAEIPGLTDKFDDIKKRIDAEDISETEKITRFQNAVVAQRKAANADYQAKQQQLRMHNEQLKAQSQAAEDQFVQRIYPGSQNPPSVQEIVQNKFLTPESKRTVTQFLERQNQQDPATEVSKKNAMALVGAMALPDGNPNKLVSEQPIYDAYTSGNLTQADFKFAQSEFRNLHGPEGEQTKTKQEWIKAVTHKIQGPPGFSQFDTNAGVRLFNYQQWVDQKLKEAGPNWRDLFREDNKDYLGSDAALKPYMPGRAEVQNAADKAFQGGPTGPNLEALSKDELGAWARSQGTAEAFDKAYEIGVRKGFIAPNAPPQGSQAPVR